MMRKGIIGCLTGLVLAGVSSVVADAGEPVRVHATILIASNQGSDFDLDNDAFRDRLIDLFSYSAYRQVRTDVMVLERSVRQKAALPDGFELLLNYQGREETGGASRILVQALIRKNGEQYLDTVLSLLEPGVVFLGGPPAEGGYLIIVLETGY